MRGGLIIETLTHLALALTRWAWFALIVFVIFGAHAFIWGTTSAQGGFSSPVTRRRPAGALAG
jgi:uncharacterized SAM-binding protein YcdF (DUF218 family)